MRSRKVTIGLGEDVRPNPRSLEAEETEGAIGCVEVDIIGVASCVVRCVVRYFRQISQVRAEVAPDQTRFRLSIQIVAQHAIFCNSHAMMIL